jgi:hypothetical protein
MAVMRSPLCTVAAAALLPLGFACGGDETPPVLSTPMVDLAHVVEFLPFGSALPGSGVLNPAYELRTDVDTVEVVAVAPGVVTYIRSQEGDDEIMIRPVEDSVWLIVYDHVVGTTVHVGSKVKAGTVLGRVGAWSAPMGRTELQINRDDDGELAHCPEQFGTAAFNDAHAAAMERVSPGALPCVANTVVP